MMTKHAEKTSVCLWIGQQYIKSSGMLQTSLSSPTSILIIKAKIAHSQTQILFELFILISITPPLYEGVLALKWSDDSNCRIVTAHRNRQATTMNVVNLTTTCICIKEDFKQSPKVPYFLSLIAFLAQNTDLSVVVPPFISLLSVPTLMNN